VPTSVQAESGSDEGGTARPDRVLSAATLRSGSATMIVGCPRGSQSGSRRVVLAGLAPGRASRLTLADGPALRVVVALMGAGMVGVLLTSPDGLTSRPRGLAGEELTSRRPDRG
jgi:hypothetical protein